MTAMAAGWAARRAQSPGKLPGEMIEKIVNIIRDVIGEGKLSSIDNEYLKAKRLSYRTRRIEVVRANAESANCCVSPKTVE